MTIWRHLALSAAIFVVTLSSAKATTLGGRINSDQVNPVSGVLVSVQSTVASGSGISTYSALTDAQGKFSINIPNPGTYSICVGSRTRFLLSSCEWALSQSLVTIKSGQAAATANITLKTGVVLHIRLNDPSQLLPQPAAVATVQNSAAVHVNAFVNGSQHLASVVSTDSGGQNLEMLVPLNAAISLGIQASNVQVLDQTQKVVGPAAINISSAPGSVPQLLIYQVAPVAVSPGKANAQK